MQPEHRPLLAPDLVLVVGVDQEREHRPVGAGGRLDHVRDVALLGRRVDVLELLAGVLGVLGEVEVAAVGDPLELGPADREQVLDVAGAARVVRQLVGVVRAQPQVVGADPELEVPVQPLLEPVLEPPLGLVGRDEELHLHLLELARAEDEVAGGDLVAEALADLGDPERRLLARELQVVLEVQEDALGGLGPQVDGRALLLDRADRGLEHQVEVPRLGEVAVRRLAGVLGRLAPAGRLVEVVGAEPQLARAAVHQRIGEPGQVPARQPGAGVLDDRRVQRDDVVALLEHRPPPAGP